MTGYPGAKTQPGVRQQIISLMPPHRVYVEPFFGTGAVFYAKKPAQVLSIVADRDEALIARHAEKPRPATQYLVADALELLTSLPLTRRDLVYLDPPYHPDSRTKKKLYRHELSADDHAGLLRILEHIGCNVILSGYRCEAYDRALSSWHRLDYQTMTRGGGAHRKRLVQLHARRRAARHAFRRLQLPRARADQTKESQVGRAIHSDAAGRARSDR